jgi:Na+/H+ antiporter NhaD/arsenite permease-like protein
MEHEPIRIHGAWNLLFLAGVMAAVLGKGHYQWSWGVQEAIMAAMALAAYFTTPAATRENNRFTFGPIVEVAVLFIGIFITMAPALQILNAWGAGHRTDMGPFTLDQPWQFFWATGMLSSFLDNAPTYITMAATASGLKGIAAEGAYLAQFIAAQGGAEILAAISCGSVFMGANTYIGNGPNFMVKAMAEEDQVRMPSFFGYLLYSVSILIPLFIVTTWLFF